MGVPERYWALQREHFQERPYYNHLHDYIVGMSEVLREGRSLCIIGPTLSGKSALAAYIARIYREYGVWTRFVSAHQIHQDIEHRIYDTQDEKQMEQIYQETHLLVIDGMGSEAKRFSHIPCLFEHRYQWLKPTIFTATVEDLSELDGLQLYPPYWRSKLAGACEIVRC